MEQREKFRLYRLNQARAVLLSQGDTRYYRSLIAGNPNLKNLPAVSHEDVLATLSPDELERVRALSGG